MNQDQLQSIADQMATAVDATPAQKRLYDAATALVWAAVDGTDVPDGVSQIVVSRVYDALTDKTPFTATDLHSWLGIAEAPEDPLEDLLAIGLHMFHNVEALEEAMSRVRASGPEFYDLPASKPLRGHCASFSHLDDLGWFDDKGPKEHQEEFLKNMELDQAKSRINRPDHKPPRVVVLGSGASASMSAAIAERLRSAGMVTEAAALPPAGLKRGSISTSQSAAYDMRPPQPPKQKGSANPAGSKLARKAAKGRLGL